MSKLILILMILSSCLMAEDLNPKVKKWEVHEVASKRAMWVWGPTRAKLWDGEKKGPRWRANYKNCNDLLLDFCQNKSIRVLYLSVSSWQWGKEMFTKGELVDEQHYVDFIAKARKRGIQVWAVYYINDVADRVKPGIHGVIPIIDTIAAYNKKYPESQFAGIQSDQEPKSPAVWGDLMKFLEVGQAHVDKVAPGLIFSQTLKPSYAVKKFSWKGEEKLFCEHILDVVDHVSLMAYNDNYTKALQWPERVCKYATKVKKKASIGFEVDDLSRMNYDAEPETWSEEILAEKNRFDGSKGTFEAAMEKMNQELSKYSGYDRMVIHAYRPYFGLWFSEDGKYEPIDHPAKWAKPSRVDLSKDNRELYKK